MNVVILQAGLRSPSSTRLLADELAREVGAAVPGSSVRVVDLRDHAHAIMDAMLQGFAAPDLQEVLDAVVAADGLVVVTPTFQASYSGLFKSFIDLIEPGTLREVPTILAATGGTERHSLVLEHALRPLMVHLGADPVRTAIFAATSDFGSPALSGRARRAAGELAARLGVASAAERGEAPKNAEPEDFESMMARMGVGR